MRASSAALRAAASSLVAALGCSEAGPGVSSIWVLPGAPGELRGERFFDAPWPSDLRRGGGAVRLDGYHNPRQLRTLGEYIRTMDSVLDGFSPAAAGFLRFAGPIDPASLPETPVFAMSPVGPVQLIDVDPASPARGERRPVSVYFRREAGVYWPENTLAFMPGMGFPLRPRTRYALVVTDALRGEDGRPVQASPDLRRALGIDEAGAGDPAEAVREALAPAVDEIEAAGVGRERIVHLAVFTTSDPTAELFALRDHLLANVPPPEARPALWRLVNHKETWDEYAGVYGPSPSYQAGSAPYLNHDDGGGFARRDGEPEISGMFDLRFSLTVPAASRCPMPEAGYPIVLYAHGTGGDYRSYVHTHTGRQLARRCLAVMGVDQIFHGARPEAPQDPTQAGVLFYNVQNVSAARTNARQSALDEVQRARLFTESGLTVPAWVSSTGEEIRFDPSKILFFGHSQGGLNGPLYLAADDSARGGVLSGASAVMSITLIEKTNPPPSVAGLVSSVFLGLRGEEVAEVNEFHPAISLAQSIVDVVDPIHYAARLVVAPRDGFAPKSIYMTEGINPDGSGDTYAPPRGIEMHALAMGLPLQSPAQRLIREYGWGGPPPVEVPAGGLAGNLAGGRASGVLAQWPVAEGSDGHFVVFDVPGATAQAHGFLQNLAEAPVGRVPAP
ncbi:uncharacterized protein SOCE26_024290 [Sorangium cellulosum]|uniref:Bacterial virulence factor lipase N-terminal domain-containing protein n=1 Tax=Sorangium cellulosum TaxID=56 RepID=A0A2L0EP21_SORCE|nr:hypothetical protein [Sorangium cellulosum]AUX41025.1 uncharacterized protein SOCE26_024290 [Sorangium cellulosum]